MLKIKQIKNWYGISKLLNAELIDGNTIIYSANGIMKTSFADGIHDLSQNLSPRDVFNDMDAEYQIWNNQSEINQNSEKKTLDVIVFRSSDFNENIYSDPRISQLVVSNDLKAAYKNEMEKIENTVKEVKKLIASEISKDKKNSDAFFKFIFKNSGLQNEIEFLIDFIQNIGTVKMEGDISEISLSKLFNDASTAVFSDNSFIQKSSIYNNLISKKFDEKIFNNNFSLNDLIAINQQLVSTHFFDAQHSINLSDEKYDKDKLQKFIDTTIKEIYETSEAKNTFDEIKKTFSKKNLTNLNQVINDYPWLVSHMNDWQKLLQNMINHNSYQVLKDLQNYQKELINARTEIQKIFEIAKEQDSQWKNILEIYNQRFVNDNFDITIENSINSILGNESPIFKKILKSNNKIITQEFLKRFSAGEKRALYILNLLYEIEILRLENKPFTLILDDVVDSFDYKNKYSMLEYLKELVDDNLIQSIILTHNFDFYRSCRQAFGDKLNSKLIAYKDTNAIALKKWDSKELDDFSFFKSWKKRENFKSLIGILPFLRNIYELEKEANSNEYNLICNFLHYKDEMDERNLNELSSIFQNYHVKIKKGFDQQNYFTILINEVNVLLTSKINEIDLLEKVVLSIFIRLALEKIMLNRFKDSYPDQNIEDKGSNWTETLYNAVKDKLSDEEKKLYNQTIIVAPSFIHLNSFMFEPLIDVGVQKICRIVIDLKKYLQIK